MGPQGKKAAVFAFEGGKFNYFATLSEMLAHFA
jgi:hypothetical protein